MQAFVLYSLSGVTDSAPPTSYLLQAQFGTLNGRQVRYSGQGGWFGMTWADQFTDIEAITSGDRLIRIRANGSKAPAATGGGSSTSPTSP